MLKWFAPIFLGITIIFYLLIGRNQPVESNAPNIVLLKDSTVLLLEQIGSNHYQISCAGVWISNRHFLTANHCISDPNIQFQIYKYKNKYTNGYYYESYSGILLKQDEDLDLALVLGLSDTHSFVSIADDSDTGDKVWTLGHPSKLSYSLSEGIISAKRNNSVDNKIYKLLQVDASIGPGNSGGGLFNHHSQLLGICSFITTNGAKFGFFVEQEDIKSFLQDIKY